MEKLCANNNQQEKLLNLKSLKEMKIISYIQFQRFEILKTTINLGTPSDLI